MRTDFFRRWYVLLLAGVLVFVVVGCSTPNESPPPVAETAVVPDASEPEPTAASETTEQPAQPGIAPLSFSGDADTVVDFEKSDDPAIVKVTATEGFITVDAYDADGEYITSVVSGAGPYSGVVALDFFEGEHTARFEIQAQGPWTVEILPITEAETITIPGTYNGKDDMIYRIEGDASIVRGSVDDGYFSVDMYGENRVAVLSGIGPYEGEQEMPDDMRIVEIASRGNWTLEFEE